MVGLPTYCRLPPQHKEDRMAEQEEGVQEEDSPDPIPAPSDETEPMRAYYDALWEAQAQAPRVIRADEKFEGPGHWMFASQMTYQRVLVPILLDNHLVMELADVGPVEDLELETKSGGLQWMSTLECTFRVVHVPSGFAQIYRIRGRRVNDTDKGVQHAITSATKTFLQRLLNVSDAENAEANEVQVSQASRTTKTGQRKPRTPQGNQSESPPPDQKPPSPPNPTITPAERLELAKEDIKASLRKNHMRVYHLEALAQMHPNLPDELEKWGLADYEVVQIVLQKDPVRCEKAMAELSEKFPTDDMRLRKLHDLQVKLEAEGNKISPEERILTASAHHSGWSDAVEYWIDKLNTRIRGQTEADV